MKEILTLTTQRVPREATHWSVRLMAKYAAVTAWQVRQVWAASDLKPHRLKTFKIGNDPHFADKVVDCRALSESAGSNDYIEAHRAGWKNIKHAQQWTNTLDNYANPRHRRPRD